MATAVPGQSAPLERLSPQLADHKTTWISFLGSGSVRTAHKLTYEKHHCLVAGSEGVNLCSIPTCSSNRDWRIGASLTVGNRLECALSLDELIACNTE